MASVKPCAPTHAAGCMKARPSVPGTSHALPSRFQGKPVSANCRAKSPKTQPPASTATWRQPAGTVQASAQGMATNRPSTAASSGTAIGTAHQN